MGERTFDQQDGPSRMHGKEPCEDTSLQGHVQGWLDSDPPQGLEVLPGWPFLVFQDEDTEVLRVAADYVSSAVPTDMPGEDRT
jgi:hypothetical protein